MPRNALVEKGGPVWKLDSDRVPVKGARGKRAWGTSPPGYAGHQPALPSQPGLPSQVIDVSDSYPTHPLDRGEARAVRGAPVSPCVVLREAVPGVCRGPAGRPGQGGHTVPRVMTYC